MQKTNGTWEYNLAAKLFIILASITILVAGQTFFIPFVISIFLAFLLYPISSRLERLKVPKSIAIIISILIAVIVFGALIWFVIDQFMSFQEDLPLLKSKLKEKVNHLIVWISHLLNTEPTRIESWLIQKLKESNGAERNVVIGIFSFTGMFLAMLGLIPIYVFFLTYFKDKYKVFVKLVSNENSNYTIQLLEKISTVSKSYLKGVFLDFAILSILGSIGYLILGLEHAILFGVLAALLNIIPYIGALIGSLFPVMMALLTKDEIGFVFGTMAVAIVVQFLDNNFINPYVVGSSVSINPLTAIIVLIVGALMWGISGMILSIPLAGVLKVICDNIESLKPYGYLIGEEVTYKKKITFTTIKLKSKR